MSGGANVLLGANVLVVGRVKDAESQFGKGSTLDWPAPSERGEPCTRAQNGGGYLVGGEGGYAGHGKVWGTVR